MRTDSNLNLLAIGQTYIAPARAAGTLTRAPSAYVSRAAVDRAVSHAVDGVDGAISAQSRCDVGAISISAGHV
jgi:hypothetical protein